MAIQDIFKDRAKAENWQVTDAGKLQQSTTIEADVVIIGTGAGGGVTAEVLSQSGLNVVMIEEGGLYTSDDFNMDEMESTTTLYQEAAGRTTKDGAISIFQGRAVGGTTVINWTSCFRTPEPTLSHWKNLSRLISPTIGSLTKHFAPASSRSAKAGTYSFFNYLIYLRPYCASVSTGC